MFLLILIQGIKHLLDSSIEILSPPYQIDEEHHQNDFPACKEDENIESQPLTHRITVRRLSLITGIFSEDKPEQHEIENPKTDLSIAEEHLPIFKLEEYILKSRIDEPYGHQNSQDATHYSLDNQRATNSQNDSK
jgi:hypothetical protein